LADNSGYLQLPQGFAAIGGLSRKAKCRLMGNGRLCGYGKLSGLFG